MQSKMEDLAKESKVYERIRTSLFPDISKEEWAELSSSPGWGVMIIEHCPDAGSDVYEVVIQVPASPTELAEKAIVILEEAFPKTKGRYYYQ